jgi:adenylate cyclase
MPNGDHHKPASLLQRMASAIASQAEVQAFDPLRPWRMISRSNAFIIPLSLLVFALYAVYTHGFNRIALLTSPIAGLPIGFAIAFVETQASEFKRRHRRTGFWAYLFFRTLRVTSWFMVMFILMMMVVHWLRIETGKTIFPESLREFFTTRKVFEFLGISLAISLVSNFLDELHRKLGRDAIFSLVLGKYHKVRQEERLFLFIDLNGSTRLAEEMGEMTFSHFLQDFYYDISEPIARYKGRIYQYVGDEVVVSWPLRQGLKNAQCLRCFFAIGKQLRRYENQYRRQYNTAPSFKAALHGGSVVVSEVGKYKSEIAYHGDVLNTTARMMSKCHELNSLFITSAWVAQQAQLPAYIKIHSLGLQQFRGKQQEMELFAVQLAGTKFEKPAAALQQAFAEATHSGVY